VTGRGPLNYTTTIDADKSAMECISILTKHGATKIGISVGEDRQPDGLDFLIKTPFGMRGYSLPVNIPGTEKALLAAWRERKIEPRFKEPAQARRVAWRVLKDWLEAQLALIEAGAVDLPQVMLPYMRVEDGQTLYAAWLEGETRALERGGTLRRCSGRCRTSRDLGG
jgi:hypothetical protein